MEGQVYTLQLATLEDEEQIEKYINENFYADMPMFSVFGIVDLPDLKEDNTKDDENFAFVLKAVSSEGEIVGVAVNRKKPPNYLFSENTDQKIIQMFEFMDFIKDESKITELPERTVELYILSVTSGWRNKGIAKRLTEESLRVAKEMGFELMKVCCANEYTTRAVRRLGFQEFYTLAYSDYCKVTGRDVTLRIVPPHLNVSFYIKRL